MSLSSICVVSNALRLKGVKLSGKAEAKTEPEPVEKEIIRKEEKGMKETTISIEGIDVLTLHRNRRKGTCRH